MQRYQLYRALPCVLLIISGSLYAQTGNREAQKLKSEADSLFVAKEYLKAARVYMEESATHTMIPFKKNAIQNAAAAFAITGMADSAFYCLEQSFHKYGLASTGIFEIDGFKPYRNDARYKKLYAQVLKRSRQYNQPSKAKIETSDIDLFWKVYDRFLQDTVNASTLFLEAYFKKGTVALQEYYRLKTRNIGGLAGFVTNMKTMPLYYQGIRSNTLKVKTLEDTIRQIYKRLHALYPKSVYPPLTFVIGGWSSGGTVTEYGQNVGADMYARNPETDISELNPWQKRNSTLFIGLKATVAHELIHAQQSEMGRDTTLLYYVIKEGMADFICELISGTTANEGLHVAAKGKEKIIWEAFKKEMYLDRYFNWISNTNQERPDWPADLGYWVGYQICKAYYEQASDKKKAIHDMLNLKDYEGFYRQSKIEDKLVSGVF